MAGQTSRFIPWLAYFHVQIKLTRASYDVEHLLYSCPSITTFITCELHFTVEFVSVIFIRLSTIKYMYSVPKLQIFKLNFKFALKVQRKDLNFKSEVHACLLQDPTFLLAT